MECPTKKINNSRTTKRDFNLGLLTSMTRPITISPVSGLYLKNHLNSSSINNATCTKPLFLFNFPKNSYTENKTALRLNIK